MKDVSVNELAKIVGTSPDSLKEQLKAAGIEISDLEQKITPEQRKQLLTYLQSSRGSSNTIEMSPDSTVKERPKITLSRKQVGVVKQGKKNVNVEIRTKRTFTKPTSTDEQVTPLAEIQENNEDQISATQTSIEPSTEEIKAEPCAQTKITSAPVPETKPKETLKKAKDKRKTNEGDALGERVPSKKTRKETRGRGHQLLIVEEDEEDLSSLQQEALFIARSGSRRRKKAKTFQKGATLEHGFEKPTTPIIHEVTIPTFISVAELAQKMSVKAAEVIKVMMTMGAMVTINQKIDQDTAVLVVAEMGHVPKAVNEEILEETLLTEEAQAEVSGELVPRPSVVTIMGHVDHGKTSLLDYIRRTKVASGEAGGITQHIGAYHVETSKGVITFLDTPGHEAFTAMRARGAKCTDIVILVVAADDGVKPQTIEAIQHARAAQVPIVVAVNKIDKPEADPEKVKTELSRYEVLAEDWGGETIFQHISAKTGQGVDELLDSIILQAEVLELKAIAEGPAKGMIIESRLDNRRGPVATVLVTKGKLKKGDVLLAGRQYGRVRAMIGDNGEFCDEAGPSIPVEVLGLSGTPSAGDEAIVVPDERRAREIAELRQGKYREVRLARQQTASLDNLFDQLNEGGRNVLNIVLKADVQGSLEAITEALKKLPTKEVKVNITASGVGGITESDVNLAIASNAVIVGFNVRADASTRSLIEREGVDLRYYSVIYNLIDEVKSALTGLLAPKFEEKIMGLAQVREVFRSSKFGSIAGCMVIEGVIKRNLPIRVLRDNVVIYEGELESLRRFKEDVSEVRNGTECGIGVKNYNDIKPGDQIEVYQRVQVARHLEQ